ncbi:FAS1-like dehydratase domain-containing protein [Eleftheria terrae]|uniref:FAS1-like dehydratase domain-containing protein n=1 Tax=Eleftheria terrae TaxID=1597781 RepID=UPI00263B74AB|nr:MaoC family dehydratase N-terminal domain-containing protein [Eleftheria terrae]WKB55906.1 MaoC family dehydratase N-terminal domain-containing protein [Eleftheria terrae]
MSTVPAGPAALPLDLDALRTWIGRRETADDIATPVPLQALAATLDRNDPVPRTGDRVPPCWHWLYFLPLHRQSDIGADGHAQRGGFLPPVPLPRRMWAGSRLTFHRPLQVGQALHRQSTIADVRLRQGRTGALVFVAVRHDVHAEGSLCVSDEHTIVYRDLPAPGEPAPEGLPPPLHADWEHQVRPDDVLLFRYSALTFNGHRIHYDRRYAMAVEGYPGLVVHGPLIATLLLELLRSRLPHATVRGFEFRAVRPVFDTAPFSVCGRRLGASTVQLWARTADGFLAMEAVATLAPDTGHIPC